MQTIDQLRQEQTDLGEERDRLAAEAEQILTRSTGSLAGDDAARFDQIEARLTEIGGREQRVTALLRAVSPAGEIRQGFGERAEPPRAPALVTRTDPWTDDRSDAPTRAARAVDELHRDGSLPDHAAETVTGLLGRDGDPARRWLLATSDPAYSRAFARMLADPMTGHAEFDDAERAAWRRVRDLQRAMAVGSDAAGGFMVPTVLDPAIMLTSDGSVNPLRRISRVVQTVGSSWNGITSAGSTAEWKTENAEAADASPTVASPNIPVYLGDAFVPYSFEAGQDAANLTGELQRVLMDAADQLQATAYMKGTGSAQPTGLVTSLPAGSKLASTTADSIVAADVVKLQNALPPRFQPNAQWCANLTTINTVGSFETTNGALRFPEVGSGRLLNRPLNEASMLDSAGKTASAGNDNVLLYGDFRQFVIVDRVGTTMELIQNLFGTNGRPKGQRGALLWFRTGSDVVVDNAFRLLTA